MTLEHKLKIAKSIASSLTLVMLGVDIGVFLWLRRKQRSGSKISIIDINWPLLCWAGLIFLLCGLNFTSMLLGVGNDSLLMAYQVTVACFFLWLYYDRIHKCATIRQLRVRIGRMQVAK